MSFSKIKALYAIAVLSLAVLLFVPDTFVRGTAAVFLLIGALPIWRALVGSAFDQGLNDSEHTLDLILDELIESDDHQAKP